jgi:hypothetical protein
MTDPTTLTRNINNPTVPSTGSSQDYVSIADRDQRFKSVLQRQLGTTGLTLVTNLTMLFLIAFVTLIGVMIALMGDKFGCASRRAAAHRASVASGNKMALLLPAVSSAKK